MNLEREKLIVSNNKTIVNENSRLKEQIQLLQNKASNDQKMIQMEKQNTTNCKKMLQEEIDDLKQEFRSEGKYVFIINGIIVNDDLPFFNFATY